MMLRTLVKTTELEVGDRRYHAHYYETTTGSGSRRYTCEIALGPNDRIILDDDSLSGLESSVARLAPATVQSRKLAGKKNKDAAA